MCSNPSPPSPKPSFHIKIPHSIGKVNRVKGSGTCFHVYAYTCARNNIKVCFESLFPSFPKSSLPTSLRISVLQKSLKKPCMKVWWICFKALILHPLSREKGDTVDMLRREKVMNDRLMKTFWNFFFKKVLVVQKFALSLHPLSKRKPIRRVLWKI